MYEYQKFQRVLDAFNPAPKLYSENNWKSRFGYAMSSLKSKPELIAATARLYQEIFGNDPIWGEGAYCSREGWDKRISLSEYESLLAQNSCPVCSCGAQYQPCHSYDKVANRLASLCAQHAFALAMLDRNGNPRGFTCGTEESIDDCVETVIKTRYKNRDVLGRQELSALSQRLAESSCDMSKRILYVEEVAVAKDARSLETAMIVCEAALSQGLNSSSGQGLFWTSSDTAIFQLSLGVGFIPILTTSDGITFLFCRDLCTAVSILRSLSPRKYAVHCARVLRSQQQQE